MHLREGAGEDDMAQDDAGYDAHPNVYGKGWVAQRTNYPDPLILQEAFAPSRARFLLVTSLCTNKEKLLAAGQPPAGKIYFEVRARRALLLLFRCSPQQVELIVWANARYVSQSI